MKWVALVLLLAAIPILTGFLRQTPRARPFIWSLLTFLPFVVAPWHLIVSPYAAPMWAGYVKGWDFTVLDAVAIAVLASSRVRWPGTALAATFLLYLAAVIFAVFQARFLSLSVAYAIQLVRIGLVALAISQVAFLERGEKALIAGLAAGIGIQALYAIAARMGGALQTGGSMGHQNLLGFVSHMAVMPCFALLLAGRFQKTAMVGLAAGVIAVALTASRATILISGFGLTLTLMLSLLTRSSAKKFAFAAVGSIVLAGGFFLAYESLQRRFVVQRVTLLQEDSQRQAFARTAWEIAANKPLGVGPNFYNFIANTEGYSARAGVSPTFENRAAQVHNGYLLTLAETGYLGLSALILVFASALWYSLSSAIRYRRVVDSEIMIGLFAALVCIIIHSFAEWMILLYPTQYLFAAILGLIAGVRLRLLYRGREGVSASGKMLPVPRINLRAATSS